MSARTVRVRIAVAVDADGDWNSCGGAGVSDFECIEAASECIATPSNLCWVEADLPIPEAMTVQGVVTPGGE